MAGQRADQRSGLALRTQVGVDGPDGPLGTTFVLLALVSDGAYALLAGTAGRWLSRHPRFVRGERYVSGSMYPGRGAFAALSGSGSSQTGALPPP